jgi:tetratricopeptide (TPR) repeat protein
MVRKEHLDAVGELDEKLRQSPDYDLYLRLSKKYPYACLNELLCQYRVHESNISGNLDGRLKAHLRIFSKPEIVGDLGFFYGIRRRAKAFYQVGALYYQEGRYMKAFQNFSHCILRDPILGFTYYDRRFRHVPLAGAYSILKIYYLAVLSLVKCLSPEKQSKEKNS